MVETVNSPEVIALLREMAPDAIVVIDAERQCFLSGNPNAGAGDPAYNM